VRNVKAPTGTTSAEKSASDHEKSASEYADRMVAAILRAREMREHSVEALALGIMFFTEGPIAPNQAVLQAELQLGERVIRGMPVPPADDERTKMIVDRIASTLKRPEVERVLHDTSREGDALARILFINLVQHLVPDYERPHPAAITVDAVLLFEHAKWLMRQQANEDGDEGDDGEDDRDDSLIEHVVRFSSEDGDDR